MALGLPCLSSEGYTTDRGTILEKLFMYWVAAQPQDSNYYKDYIISIDYTLSKSDSIRETVLYLEDDLTRLYSPYFDSVEPVVTPRDNIEVDGQVLIDIEVTCEYQGKTYALKKLLKTSRTNHLNTFELLQYYNYQKSI